MSDLPDWATDDLIDAIAGVIHDYSAEFGELDLKDSARAVIRLAAEAHPVKVSKSKNPHFLDAWKIE